LDDRNFMNAKGYRDANRALASKEKILLSLKNEMKSLNSAIEKRNKTIKSQKETIVILQNRPSQNKNEEEIKKLRKIIDEEKIKTKMVQRALRSQVQEIYNLKENDKTEEIEALQAELEYLRDQNPDECSICCKNFDSKNNQKSCLSSCGHQFCYECLKKILEKHNSECPTCRTGFEEKQIIKLF
jgi:chromosome segregation ATPase